MWQALTFSTPATAGAACDAVQPVVAGVGAELTEAQGRLAPVASMAVAATSPLAAGATGVGAARSSLQALLAGGGKALCVHPYVHPVGDKRGDYSFLPPAECVRALAAKVTDAQDPLPEGILSAVVVLLGANNHAAFRDALAAFTAVFPVSELLLAQRRAHWLHTLEEDKLSTFTAPIHPYWKTCLPHTYTTGGTLETHTSTLLAIADGYNSQNTTPAAELQALLVKKAEQAQAQQAAWAAFASTLQGQAGTGVYLQGSAQYMRSELLGNLPQEHHNKLSAALCWLGTAEQVAFFKELFAL